MGWRLLFVLSALIFVAGCPSTRIPQIYGVVVDSTTGRPVKDAIVLASFVGHTMARDAWFLAHANIQQSRCFRIVLHTDGDGAFQIFPQEIGAYFGEPYWSFKVFHRGYRSLVDGYRAKVAEPVRIAVWPDELAEEFNEFSGDRVDYSRAEHPDLLRRNQRSLAQYLDDWLAYGQLLPTCDFEVHASERHRLIFDLYREWISLGGPQVNNGHSSACPAFGSLRLDHPTQSETEEFSALRDLVLQSCGVVRKSASAYN